MTDETCPKCGLSTMFSVKKYIRRKVEKTEATKEWCGTDCPEGEHIHILCACGYIDWKNTADHKESV